jgi:hypothetical protein
MFKRLFIAAAMASALVWAGEKPKQIQVPKDAEQVSPGVFRHTDKSGKVWIYRNTPFGLSKFEDTAPEEKPATPAGKAGSAGGDAQKTPFGEVRNQKSPAAAPTAGSGISKAIDDGDTVRFERSSPFGVYRWTRKKSELTADEKAALEQSRSRSASEPGTKE